MRREAILRVATEMLDEMPVNQVTMNELSRRVGLAKSNVMRYFESREAILLGLLTRLAEEWRSEATARIEAEVPHDGDPPTRLGAVASVLARTLAQHEVLCDLISAQASVLEHNVSDDVALRYKRAALDGLAGLAVLITGVLPELDSEYAHDAAMTTTLLVGALWTHTHPSSSVAAAYETDPSLAVAQDFQQSLEHALGTYFAGLLARSEAARGR